MSRSSREQLFTVLWRTIGDRNWTPVEQHQFAPPRMWRFDFAWLSVKVAVEIHGGEFVAGRHGRGRGLMDDAEKSRAAARLGWIVIPVIGTELDERPCDVMEDIKAVLESRRQPR